MPVVGVQHGRRLHGGHRDRYRNGEGHDGETAADNQIFLYDRRTLPARADWPSLGKIRIPQQESRRTQSHQSFHFTPCRESRLIVSAAAPLRRRVRVIVERFVYSAPQWRTYGLVPPVAWRLHVSSAASANDASH